LFDQNLIQHVIDEHGLPERTAEYFPEDKPEEIRATIAELLGLHQGVYNTLIKTSETIRRLAKAGNAVIVGRGGNFITADVSPSLHIRIIGSGNCRIRHYAAQRGISHAEAATEVARIDRGRKRYIKKHFKKDIDDPIAYDLLINTDEFDIGQAVEVILCAIRQKIR
jgi:cytidylate kinase